MANGRVLTGFSYPYVSIYSCSTAGVITHSSTTVLARGVSVSLDVEDAGDDNVFYADNRSAESIEGTFTGGTVTLTVDGLFDSAEALIYGLPSASGGFVSYSAVQNAPYVSIGFVCRYMSDGVTSYVPVILNKCKFNLANLSANTQEEDIEWQTQELTARVMRDDSSSGVWKMVGTAVTTESSAVSAITGAWTNAQ